MEVFLSGLYGALLGSVSVIFTMALIYKYEEKKSTLKKTQLMNDIKSIYAEKLNKNQAFEKIPTSKLN